jgi:uncharacterized cysteine cluster protein YcgN (CxxCxxCC family)
MSTPFWRTKTLAEMSPAEWESLCDGCGRCCLVKLEDEDTGRYYYTDIACKLLDCASCRCKDYENRFARVKDCLQITPATAEEYKWLPKTCGYRRLAEGRDLAWWHPLVSGSPDTVHEAGISVRGRVSLPETQVRVRDYEDHIVRWPSYEPKPFPPGGAPRRKAAAQARPAAHPGARAKLGTVEGK